MDAHENNTGSKGPPLPISRWDAAPAHATASPFYIYECLLALILSAVFVMPSPCITVVDVNHICIFIIYLGSKNYWISAFSRLKEHPIWKPAIDIKPENTHTHTQIVPARPISWSEVPWLERRRVKNFSTAWDRTVLAFIKTSTRLDDELLISLWNC